MKWWRDDEWKTLWSLAWPMALSDMFVGSSALINVACIGLICGKDAMASVSLGQAFMSLTQTLALSTLNTLNTVCSQAIGAGNKKLAGIWLQAGFIVYTAVIVPVFISWWFLTDTVLKGMGMDHDLSKDGQRYARYSIPLYYLIGMEYAMEQYYGALGITKPAMISSGLALLLSLGFNVLFINGIPGTSWGGMGYVGAAVGSAVAMIGQLAMFLGFMYYKKYHADYWDGLSWSAAVKWSRMKEYLMLCIPTAIGALVEEGQFQLLTIFTAHMGTTDIAAWSASGALWMQLAGASMGFCKAINIRVAQHIGSGNLDLNFKAIKYGTTMISAISSVCGLSIFLFRDYVGRIFTSDDDIVRTVRDMCWLLALAIPLLNTGVVALFVMDGQGRPGLGAAIIGSSAWFLNIPFSALAVYKLGYKLNGMLFVCVCGYAVCATVSWVVIWYSDWDKLVIAAKKRSECINAEKTDRETDSETDVDEERPLVN